MPLWPPDGCHCHEQGREGGALIRLSERDLKNLQSGAPLARSIKPGSPHRPAADNQAPRPRAGRLPCVEPDVDRIIDFSAEIPPQPKQRARTFADMRALVDAFVNARGDVKRFIALVKSTVMRSVTPEATRIFEAALRQVGIAAMARAGGGPFSCPVDMEMHFRLAGDPGLWPTSHIDGDLDNMAKAVKDALNGITYTDDRLVVRVTMSKSCAIVPSVHIRLRPAYPPPV